MTPSQRFRVHIKPFNDGWAVWINGAEETFPNPARAYLDARASTWCFTTWGAHLWAKRTAKQLARTSRTSSFEIEVSK